MITLTDIAYVRSGVTDLDAAVRFATEIVGLELAAPTGVGVAHLRADHRHHCLALVEGPSGVISSGFSVADCDALAAAETELEQSGITVRRGCAQEARSRRVREFIAFDDTRPTGSGALPSTRASLTGSATRPACCGSTPSTTSWPCSRVTSRGCAT